MTFTSFEFAFFFIAVLLIQRCLRDPGVERSFLLLASYVFYATWSVPCVLLLLFVSSVSYAAGLGFAKVKDRHKRKLLLVASIVANLSVLAFFKYTDFLLQNVWWGLTFLGWHADTWHYTIILPVGISFFTFISMTYTIEVYRRNIESYRSPRDVFLFVAFFPQLLAGPINRATELLPQFKKRTRATAADFESGLAQFALGAVKKLVISDRIAPHVDLIFGAPGNYDALTLLQGLLGYTIQIYCDFSGYSDMAIGCARMMGFRFMENFQMPYSSVSITEFWRRWHISLSTWFRDYLYIPMGGNRKGPVRTYVNLLLTMLLCGLWHGASWNFVLWGGIHGVSLAINRIWSALNPFSMVPKRSWVVVMQTTLSRCLTLSVVIVAWLFFRAESWALALQYFSRLFAWDRSGTRMVSPYILMALVAVALTHLFVNKDTPWPEGMAQRSVPARVLCYTALVLCVVSLGATDSAPFIYFQF